MGNKDKHADLAEYDESDASGDLMSDFFAPIGQPAPLETVDPPSIPNAQEPTPPKHSDLSTLATVGSIV